MTRAGLVALALAVGLTACASTPGATTASSASPSASSASSTYAPRARLACDGVAQAIDRGDLPGAEALLATAPLPTADPTCVTEAESLIKARRASAEKLVEAARATPAEARNLAAAALRLDAGNVDARAMRDLRPLSESVTTPTPSPAAPSAAPSFSPQPRPSSSKSTDPCDAVTDALDAGRLSEARSLADSLPEDATCADTIKTAIVTAENKGALRSAQHRLDDSVPLLVFAAVGLVLGAGVARAVAMRLDSPARLSFVVAAVSGLALAGIVLRGPLLELGLEPLRRAPDSPWVAFGLAFVFAAAFVLWRRGVAGMAIDVVGPDGLTIDGSPLGELIVAEMGVMAGTRSSGVFAVQGGSDVSDDRSKAMLDTVTNTYLKALVTTFRALTTGLGDRAQVTLLGTVEKPTGAVVTVRRGSRAVHEETVSVDSVRVDAEKPSVSETDNAVRDLATVVAARLVLVRLRVIGGPPDRSPARLYGARKPAALALAAVGARHMDAERFSHARQLYERAQGIDPLNLVAQYGAVLSVLRESPSGVDADLAMRRLADLKVRLEKERKLPLTWRVEYNHAIAKANREFAEGDITAERQVVVEAAAGSLRALEARLGNVHPKREDRRLREDLKALAGLAAVGLEGVVPARALKAKQDLEKTTLMDGTSRLVNAACGFAIVSRTIRSQPALSHSAERAAVDRLRVVGLEESQRPRVSADPVLARTLEDCEAFAALLREWSVPAYAGLAVIGSSTASKLHVDYPDAPELLDGLADPQSCAAILATAKATEADVPWWEGALAWLEAGRDVATINAYQAAGIRGAAQAQSLTDAQVVAALHKRRTDDPTLVVPDARVRALMKT